MRGGLKWLTPFAQALIPAGSRGAELPTELSAMPAGEPPAGSPLTTATAF
jgi:hypothetical protein